jgi:cytidylate kinase
MYRAVGWKAQQEGIAPDDGPRVSELAVRARLDVEGGRVLIDDVDVTSAIRTPEIDRAAAVVARQPGVRRALVAKQQAMAAGGCVVMEGRDIGTVVFPDADVKIFLDATPEERARRRASDPAHTGRPSSVAAVAMALEARDQSDRTRTNSPLVAAADAVRVDTTGVPAEQVVDRVLAVIRGRVEP